MPHGYRQSNARFVWLMCPYLSANYVADCPPNMAQVSIYKDERTRRRQSPWILIFTRFLRVLSLGLGVSKIVNFCENGVVKCKIKFVIEGKGSRCKMVY